MCDVAIQLLRTTAGIDIGATELWVCVPPSAVTAPSAPSAPTVLPPHVRCFGAFTADLHAIATWLQQCQVTTVAMESTGVYTPPGILPLVGGIV